MDAFDEAMLGCFPLQAVPPRAGHQAGESNGTRYLAGADGLWREISLPWIRILHPVAPSVLPLPYGQLQVEVDVRCGPVPGDLLREFNSWARAAAPQEIAAALVWSETSALWRLALRTSRSASSSHVEFKEVQLDDGEHLVIDVHSHGHHPAYFSAADNRDDHGSMKFSLVVGSYNQTQPTSEMRLCMAGVVLPARFRDGELIVNFNN
jgi:PRTRC genetic system protein A